MGNSDATSMMGLVMSNADSHSALRMMEMCFDGNISDTQQIILQPSLIKDLALITYESYKMLDKHYPDIKNVKQRWDEFSALCESYRHAVHIPNVKGIEKLKNEKRYKHQENVLTSYLKELYGLNIYIDVRDHRRHIIWSDLYYAHLYSYQKPIFASAQSLSQDGNTIYQNQKLLLNLYYKMNPNFNLLDGFKPEPIDNDMKCDKVYILKEKIFDSKKIKPSNILKLLLCKIEINVVFTFLQISSLSSLLTQSDWIYYITKWIAIKYDEILDCFKAIKEYDIDDFNIICASQCKTDQFYPPDANMRENAMLLRNTCHYIRYDKRIDDVSKTNNDVKQYDFFKSVFALIKINNDYDGMKALNENILSELHLIDTCIDNLFSHLNIFDN